MVFNFASILRPRRNSKPINRARLFFEKAPDHIYAVGDIHGCYGNLLEMERLIIEDAIGLEGEKWIVYLGDYIDRGGRSADVLDYFVHTKLSGFKQYTLAGNHEELMLSYVEAPHSGHPWLAAGGNETLMSYGLDFRSRGRSSMRSLLGSHIPNEHLDFLRSAPSLLSVPGYVFVHGGLRPGVPLGAQSDRDMLWLRNRHNKTEKNTNDFVIVHGHTPVENVTFLDGSINVDTGVYYSGKLSCVRIDRSGSISVLRSFDRSVEGLTQANHGRVTG